MPLYLDQLHDDVHALGLKPDEEYYRAILPMDHTITQLRKILQWTQRIGHPETDLMCHDEGPTTTYGAVIKEAISTTASGSKFLTAYAACYKEELPDQI